MVPENSSQGQLQTVKFEIVDCYPSITEYLLPKSLKFAQNYVEVDELTTNIIMDCVQSILFSSDCAWSKKAAVPTLMSLWALLMTLKCAN